MHRNTIAYLFLLTVIIISCQTEGNTKYLRWVGDIVVDEKDNPNFEVCNGEDNIFQYFNLGEGPMYPGEKSSILKTFQTKYNPIDAINQNGLIRIRFIVNCKGNAGRFRTLQSDFNYNNIEFDQRIVSQLVDITKEIENWVILSRNEHPIDYYFYLIFKINNGHITEILP